MADDGGGVAARQLIQGAWHVGETPERVMWGQGAVSGASCPARWRSPGVAGVRRRTERGRDGDLIVISKNSGTALKTKIFSLFLDSNEKLLNTIFV